MFDHVGRHHPRDPGTTIRARQVRGLLETMYTTEPCLVEPISADPTEEWSPEMAFDPTDLVDPEEGLYIWSSVNTVMDAIKSGKLEDSDRIRLTEALEDVRF